MDDDDASWMRPGAAAATVEGARRVILCVISAMLQRSNEAVESNRSRGRVDTGRSMLFFACCSSSLDRWEHNNKDDDDVPLPPSDTPQRG